MIQFVFLTPKPPMLPAPPANRPYIGGIFGTNLLCVLLHILYDAPSAGEATRGYLHGGLPMDFIGQRGPSSKVLLLLLDLLVLSLQLVHLSAHITRQRLKGDGIGAAINVTTPSGRQYAAAPTATAQSRQDLDAEERGVRRSDEQARNEEIEMQNLTSAGTATASSTSQQRGTESEDTSERDSLLASTNTAARTDAHIFDAFNSGQIIVADLEVWSTIKEQFWAYRYPPPVSETVPAVTSSRELRANIFGQLLRWRFTPATMGRVG